MMWFGAKPFAPVCEESRRLATPVGGACAWCKEAILPTDEGFVSPLVGAGGLPELAPWHYACFLRTIVGSVAHQTGRCTCFPAGSKEPAPWDEEAGEALACEVAVPEGASRREEAERAVALWRSR